MVRKKSLLLLLLLLLLPPPLLYYSSTFFLQYYSTTVIVYTPSVYYTRFMAPFGPDDCCCLGPSHFLSPSWTIECGWL